MTENPPPPTAGPTAYQAAPPLPPTSVPLMRRDQNKVVAGVCAGVAHRLGIDPNVVRVVTVVLAIFGGAGILLYAAGWLLLPEERTGLSLGERALRGGAPDGVGTVLLALALLVVTVGAGIGILSDNWFATVVLLVAVAVGAVLLTRRPDTPSVPAPGLAPSAPPSPDTGAAASAYPAYPYPAYSAAAYPYGAPQPVESPAGQALPEQARQPRPRPFLGPVTAFAALVVVGLLGLLDARGASVPVAGYLAAALAVVGTGLVVGTWFGRSRGLIAVGVALVVLLVPIATVEQLGADATAGPSFESVTVVPDDAAQIDGTSTDYGAGDIRYDLTELDLSGQQVDLALRVGAGELVVVVPDDVTLVLQAQVGAGELTALGEPSSGLGVTTDRTVEGDPGAGTLTLDLSVGLGSLEVSRENA